jgi:hypothetical protein
VQHAAEIAGICAAVLGTVSLSLLFACSEALGEARGPGSLYRAVRNGLMRATHAQPAETLITAAPSPWRAAFFAALFSFALLVGANLALSSSRRTLGLETHAAGAALFLGAAVLLPLSEWLGETSRRGLVRGFLSKSATRRPAAVGSAALLVSLVLAGSAHALYDVRHGAFAARPAPAAAEPRKPGYELTPQRLKGIWVGAVDGEALVLSVRPKPDGADRVECALNAGTRELISFEALVVRGRGLMGRALPGLEVHFGAAYVDSGARLWIPLVDEEGRVRGQLSQTGP